MYRVSDEQIDFILNDIRRRGVEIEDLQNNLLDHICCVLERDCKETDDFEIIYQQTLKQFFKHELWEIEEETIYLLRFKHYYKMKRLLYILLFLSISFNVYVFSRMGYDYYKEKKRWSEMGWERKTTLNEGFNLLTSKIKQEYPNIASRKYYSVYFHSRFMFEYDDIDIHEYNTEDTTFFNPRKARIAYEKECYKLDSLAAIYNKNHALIIAYCTNSNKVQEEIEQLKPKFKHLLFLKGLNPLLSGYHNHKKHSYISTPVAFVFDEKGKIVYEVKSSYKIDTFLTVFMRKHPN